MLCVLFHVSKYACVCMTMYVVCIQLMVLLFERKKDSFGFNILCSQLGLLVNSMHSTLDSLVEQSVFVLFNCFSLFLWHMLLIAHMNVYVFVQLKFCAILWS